MTQKLRFCSIALFAALLFVASDAVPETGSDGSGTAFLIISIDSAFDVPDVSLHCQSSEDGGCHDNRCGCKKRKRNDKKQCECVLPTGSKIVLVPVGTFVAGYDVRNTFFQSADNVTSDALANAIATLGDIEYLNGNEATIVGAVDTTGPNSIHLLTADPDAVPPEVQEAFFFATPYLDALLPEEYPTTTVDLGNFIYLHQEPAMATLQQILDALYLTQATLECTTCEAEGDLFPHDPETDDPLISYTLSFDEDGNVSVEGCTRLDMDVKAGNGDSTDSINLGSEGLTPLVIYSSMGTRPDGNGGTANVLFFDPGEIDPDTVRFGAAKEHGVGGQDWAGAAPVKSALEDKNGDGVKDLVLHFDTQDLGDPDLGGLTEDTTDVELHGETYDQGCVKGTDTIRVVPE